MSDSQSPHDDAAQQRPAGNPGGPSQPGPQNPPTQRPPAQRQPAQRQPGQGQAAQRPSAQRQPAQPVPQGIPAPRPVAREPQPQAPAQGAPAPRPVAQAPQTQSAPQGNGGGSAPAPPVTASGEPPREAKTGLISAHKLVWAAVALLCVAAGVVVTLLGARAVARTDTTKARQTAQQTSGEIAASVKAAIRHEEDLAIGASTYFAGNSKTTPGEFATWVHWARTLRRYPELDGLSVIALVHAPEVSAFHARLTGQTVKPATPTAAAAQTAALPTVAPAAATQPVSGLRIVPTGTRPYYCLAIASLVRRPAKSPPAGLDYCAVTPGLLQARDQDLSSFAPVLIGRTKALGMYTPVYRGDQPPASLDARMGAFVGWLSEVLVPNVVLQEALRGHGGSAVNLSYSGATANANFANGTRQPGAQSTTIRLASGWTIQSFTAPVGTGVLTNGDALALLVVGCVLSVLLGALIFLLGGGRSPVVVRIAPPRTPPSASAPSEDLHDRLTGLPNRALMLDRAECMLARANRQTGLLVGALFIDIDWFQDVNQRLGEAAGDQILKIVAERLEGVVRAGDTVGRLGGDEFVLLVETAARGARLDSLARRVVEALHKPFELDDFGPNFFLTASIGVAFGRYAAPEDLLRDAQLALHAAKAAGKDRYTLFNANMRSVIEGRGVLEAELNTALAEKQFFVLYEPIYDLSTGKVTGLEALVRWLHPKRGVVLPDDFIPLAEETGLTVPIGRWVLEEACGRAAAWNVEGHGVGISVEVSANQLNRDGFITDIRRALQQSGIEPSLLTLEIAETTVMRDVTEAVARLQEIKQLGVRIAIDDFGGSGYAYHSDLRRLPLDFLKVDRGSLAESEDEDYRTWLLEAIMIVGRDLSLTVIAKAIDSYEQLSALQTMGCTMAQGALLGKAVPANAIETVFGVSIPTTSASVAVAASEPEPDAPSA
jgi:diguanylate cyclase (GGDEF)-like protein